MVRDATKVRMYVMGIAGDDMEEGAWSVALVSKASKIVTSSSSPDKSSENHTPDEEYDLHRICFMIYDKKINSWRRGCQRTSAP